MRPSNRPSRAVRGFRIVDGLIAVAATAFGLSWAGSYSGWLITFDWARARSISLGGPNSGTQLYVAIRAAINSATYMTAAQAATWGVALVAIRRARSPRRPFWRARRPGAVACLASTAALAALLAWQSIRPHRDDLHLNVGRSGEYRFFSTGLYAAGQWVGDLDPLLNTLLRAPRLIGFVVAGAWIALGLAGAWRAEAGWMDRLGRAVGLFWIVAAVYFLFMPI